MRTLEDYLKEHHSARGSTLPHDVIERLMRSFLAVVERHCELLKSSEVQRGREVLRALGVMSIADAQEWTWLMQVVEGERAEAVLVHDSIEFARISYSTGSSSVRVDLYHLRDPNGMKDGAYGWLSELKEAMQRYAPAGSLARRGDCQLGGWGVPPVLILSGMRETPPEWSGSGTLYRVRLLYLGLWRWITDPSRAVLVEETTESHRTVEKKCWTLDLKALREEPAT